SLANLAKASGFQLENLIEYSRAFDMKVSRALKPARSKLMSTGESVRPTEGLRERRNAKRSLVRLVMGAKHLFDFLSIYKLGRILPKERRPQTVIAVFKPI